MLYFKVPRSSPPGRAGLAGCGPGQAMRAVCRHSGFKQCSLILSARATDNVNDTRCFVCGIVYLNLYDNILTFLFVCWLIDLD